MPIVSTKVEAAKAPACTEQFDPVCGKKGKEQMTYANACLDQVDIAKILYKGACK